ncbi:acyl carrier protein [Flavobacterium aciduliphilum]|uniref:Acyl carrier protein n=1 Tax=Flavobacterium aciduliphilum TaxID=1101402 RepID=A0A328YAN8_9FLAO|nr:acyl carrier protein [Flavobacterium aciduliphilum]RAR70234.1 acyl carrier protein [Flavobacterium aciduliphilum]
MEQKFITLFKEAIDSENDQISMDTRFRELDEWDSLAALSIIAMLDEEYDIIIDGNKFQKLETLSEILNYISENK